MHPAGIKKGQTVYHHSVDDLKGVVLAVHSETREATVRWNDDEEAVMKVPFYQLSRREQAVA